MCGEVSPGLRARYRVAVPAARRLSADDATTRPVDVLCLGNAIVDRLAHASPDDVAAAGMERGVMTLVDGDRAQEIDGALPHWAHAAGGCAANTAVGIASLGGRPAYAGAVGQDEAGSWYAGDLAALGVRCTVDTVDGDDPTGLCHVLITPGGDRSMATHLGAASKLHPDTVERAGVGEAGVIYIEGYLLDAPSAAGALDRAMALAKRHGTFVAITMSDPFVVSRHRDRIVGLIKDGAVDLLFGNEEEALGLSEADSLSGALDWLEAAGQTAVVTLGSQGALVTSPEGRDEIAAYPVERVEDTTGAGDLFAAGCLFGVTRGLGWNRSLRLGAFAAAEVISHVGARPAVALRDAVPDGLT
jgi:sugar/nucleoside kinase (ribokinase family)